MKTGRSPFSPPLSGSSCLTSLLQHHHLPRLHKIPSLEPVEVDPAGEGARIPPDGLAGGLVLPTE